MLRTSAWEKHISVPRNDITMEPTLPAKSNTNAARQRRTVSATRRVRGNPSPEEAELDEGDRFMNAVNEFDIVFKGFCVTVLPPQKGWYTQVPVGNQLVRSF